MTAKELDVGIGEGKQEEMRKSVYESAVAQLYTTELKTRYDSDHMSKLDIKCMRR